MTRSSPDSDLLPCPFCGGTDIDPEFWASPGVFGPGCSDCGATTESVEKWNRRIAPAQAAPSELSNLITIYRVEDDEDNLYVRVPGADIAHVKLKSKIGRALLVFDASMRAASSASPQRAGSATCDKCGAAVSCTGCGSTMTIAEIKAAQPSALSCCPERQMRAQPQAAQDDIERVAIALSKHDEYDNWSGLTERSQRHYRDAALAAIKALSRPEREVSDGDQT